jgi:hypothetical protein
VTGVFAQHQPEYARHGIVVFPCDTSTKKPLVRNYLRIGSGGANELARKFADANALGLVTGKHNRITVLDVDTTDTRVLDEALARHGKPQVMVRTATGKFHCYYRYNGERRRIRPFGADIHVDILGERGFVMAPPSQLNGGRYQIIKGSLADLDRLGLMKDIEGLSRPAPTKQPGCIVGEGNRNNALFRYCMKQAHHCDSLDDLLDVARTHNQMRLVPPLADTEVIKTAASAWGYTVRGTNWFSRGRSVVMSHADIDGLMKECPDAFILENLLRRHHWGRHFVITNAMAAIMPEGGWTTKRLARARQELERRGRIGMVRPSGYRTPALYGWPDGVVKIDHQ